MRPGVGLAPAFLAAAVAAAGAQTPPDSAPPPPRLSVSLPRDAEGALRPPGVRASGRLVGGSFGGALHDGFPVRYHFRLELRRSVRILPDRLESDVEWDAVVLLDPLTSEYDLVRSTGSEEHFPSAGLAQLDRFVGMLLHSPGEAFVVQVAPVAVVIFGFR